MRRCSRMFVKLGVIQLNLYLEISISVILSEILGVPGAPVNTIGIHYCIVKDICPCTSNSEVCRAGAKIWYRCASVVKSISLLEAANLNLDFFFDSRILPELDYWQDISHAPGHHSDVVVWHELHCTLVPVNWWDWEAWI